MGKQWGVWKQGSDGHATCNENGHGSERRFLKCLEELVAQIRAPTTS